VEIVIYKLLALRAMSLGLLLAAVQGAPAQAAGAASDVYTNLTLLDPENETRVANSYLLVENGRIVEVGVGKPRSKKAARVHDMAGRFALPGFVDAHAHLTLGPQKVEVKAGVPSITFKSSDKVSQHYGRVALAYGVTTVRNPGGDTAANVRYGETVARGDWLGPEQLAAGTIIEPPPFGAPYFAYPRTEAEWEAEVAQQARSGMTFLKLYSGLSEEEVATGIRVAHQHGLKAIGHLHKVSWTRAAQLGIDGLEHALPTSPDLLEPAQRSQYLGELGMDSKFMYRWFELADYDGPRFKEMVRLVVEKKVAINLTLVINEIVYNTDHLERAYPPEFRRHEDPETLDSALTAIRMSATGWTEDDYRRARAVMPKVLQFARVLHEAGAKMMIGTDGHGGSTFYARELSLHVQAGIPNWAVLRMATCGAADILGIGTRTGRIAPGYEADVTFLDGDPATDISHAAKVFGVMNNGNYLEVADLLVDRPLDPGVPVTNYNHSP
jgi:imidazolonepropionase-like amidohydrolase